MYVNDSADAAVFLMEHYSGALAINLGTGDELTIFEVAKPVAQVAGLEDWCVLDTSKPDKMVRKCLNSTRLKGLSWRPRVTLADGVRCTYE